MTPTSEPFSVDAWNGLRDIPRDFRCGALWGSCSFGANLSLLTKDGMSLFPSNWKWRTSQPILTYGRNFCLIWHKELSLRKNKAHSAFEMASTLRFHMARPRGYGTRKVREHTRWFQDDDFTNVPVALLQGTLYNLIRFGDQRVNISIVFGAPLFYSVFFLLTSKIQSFRKSKC